MPKNVVLLFHGWASSGQSDKAKYLTTALGDFAEVISPTMDWHRPAASIVEVALLCNDIKNNHEPNTNFLVIGTSLGAWWAEIVGLIELWPLMLVNPCFDIKSLAKYIGDNTNYATGQSFVYDQKSQDIYERLQARKNAEFDTPYQRLDKTVITATGDDTIPSKDVIAHYSNPDTKILIYKGGDHRFSDYDYLVNAITNDFINRG